MWSRRWRRGKFHIWPVRTVDEGIEILTGVPAGERGEDGDLPEDSVNGRVDRKLFELAERLQRFGQNGETGGTRRTGRASRKRARSRRYRAISRSRRRRSRSCRGIGRSRPGSERCFHYSPPQHLARFLMQQIERHVPAEHAPLHDLHRTQWPASRAARVEMREAVCAAVGAWPRCGASVLPQTVGVALEWAGAPKRGSLAERPSFQRGELVAGGQDGCIRHAGETPRRYSAHKNAFISTCSVLSTGLLTNTTCRPCAAASTCGAGAGHPSCANPVARRRLARRGRRTLPFPECPIIRPQRGQLLDRNSMFPSNARACRLA